MVKIELTVGEILASGVIGVLCRECHFERLEEIFHHPEWNFSTVSRHWQFPLEEQLSNAVMYGSKSIIILDYIIDNRERFELRDKFWIDLLWWVESGNRYAVIVRMMSRLNIDAEEIRSLYLNAVKKNKWTMVDVLIQHMTDREFVESTLMKVVFGSLKCVEKYPHVLAKLIKINHPKIVPFIETLDLEVFRFDFEDVHSLKWYTVRKLAEKFHQ